MILLLNSATITFLAVCITTNNNKSVEFSSVTRRHRSFSAVKSVWMKGTEDLEEVSTASNAGCFNEQE